MPRRWPVTLAAISDHDTLAHALWRTCRGSRGHLPEGLDVASWLADLGADIQEGRAPEGRFLAFEINDPKRRSILAPCFRDRVTHHALMTHLGPHLDRALVDDTFACRSGRGTLAAVHRARHHLCRFPWFVKVDMRAYFASIAHERLLAVLLRRVRDVGLGRMLVRIVERTPMGPTGRGLPIGSLTSQYFANTYLDGLDRFVLEQLRVAGYVRYMDDVVWWCRDRVEARRTRGDVIAWVREHRGLEVKGDGQIGRSSQGLSFLGFRIRRGSLRLVRRRKRRYVAARRRAERAFLAHGDAMALQDAYDAALAVTLHADAVAWRRSELADNPPLEA